MTFYQRIILITVLGWLSTACEQLFIEPDPTDNPAENFDLLWKTVDEKYSFFEFKNIDWDDAYRRYRPLVTEDMSEEALFKVMADMLFELRDGHVNLTSDFDVSRNWDWFQDYPANFDETILERNYLEKDFRIVGPFRTKEIRDVGYIRYASFLNIVDEEQLDQLIDGYRNAKGVIIDVRDNGGGALLNAEVIATRLAQRNANEELTVGYIRYKDGPAHDDFTRTFPLVLPEYRSFNKPVVVLTNRLVYSAANAFASYMATLPNVTLVGDVTGGGGGAPYSGELLNGWKFRFSANQLMDLDQVPIENGIAPDIRVDITPEDEAAGRDTILETALDLLQ